MRIWKYWTFDNFTRKQEIFIPDEKEGLKRRLTTLHLVGFGLASMIGAGIFVTSGTASKAAGAALPLSFLLAGISALLASLCYSEYAARFPVSGSAYSFTYASLGEMMAWFIGWNVTLEYCVSAAAVAQGWSGYLIVTLKNIWPDIEIPPMLHDYPIGLGFTFSPLSVSIILLCTLILYIGSTESAHFNVSMAAINIVIIVVILIVGSINFNVDNYYNFFGPEKAWEGISGVFAGAGIVFFSFVGFDASASMAAEVINPGKTLPVSILITLTVVTVLYISVSIVLIGMVTAATVSETAPLADAFKGYNMNWAVIVVSIGSVSILTATVLASLMGQPRIFFRMASDGLLFPQFKWVNKKGVITFGTGVSCVVASLLALLNDLESLTLMISGGTLLAYTAVSSGVIVMRYRYVPKTIGADVVSFSYGRFEKLEKFSYIVYKYLNFILIFYIINTFIFGIALRLQWHIASIICLALVDFFVFLCLQTLKQQDIPQTFKCPLVPLIPLLSVTVNIIMLTQLAVDASYRIIGWSAFGLLIYLFYGVRHSKSNNEDKCDEPLIK